MLDWVFLASQDKNMNRVASRAISGGIHIVCASLAAIALPQQAVSDDLVLHYTFDQVRDGMVKDLSGMGNHGRVVAVDRINTTGGGARRSGFPTGGQAPIPVVPMGRGTSLD